ncbi:TadE family protein [Spirillospora sp. NPDC029432]|uniref:TadE/TadG family type IV pilus assembly protein n=1 Tax=Spirillospora sp. NPDC029432 TaxID=3154599 RepID=UPI0034535EE8
MRDRGAAATEYMGMLALFLFVVGVCFEVYVSFSTVEKIEDAARTGARVGSMRSVDEGQRAAQEVMPEWLNHHTVKVSRDGDRVECEVWAKVPLLFKGVPFDADVRRRVEMPVGG